METNNGAVIYNESTRKFEVENANTMFRKFTFAEDALTKKTDRKFNLILTPEEAEFMLGMELNIKEYTPKANPDITIPNVLVTIGRYSKIHMVEVVHDPETGEALHTVKDTYVGDEDISFLTSMQIDQMDLVISPVKWTSDFGDTGIKLWVGSMYILYTPTKFQEKYGTL